MTALNQIISFPEALPKPLSREVELSLAVGAEKRNAFGALKMCLGGKASAFSELQEAPVEPLPAHWQIPNLDAFGLVPGMLAEAVGSLDEGQLSGATLFLDGIIREMAAQQGYQALIDGHDHFDPCSCGGETALFQRLLWVRCHTAAEVIKAADLLLRDGNLPLVLLDLLGNSRQELQRQPASVWYRLRALAEQSQALCLVLTPSRLVAAAQIRLELTVPSMGIDLLDIPRHELLAKLQIRVTRQRLQTASPPHSQVSALAG